MKVLFAVSNENTSQAIIKKYQSEYKQIFGWDFIIFMKFIKEKLAKWVGMI